MSSIKQHLQLHERRCGGLTLLPFGLIDALQIEARGSLPRSQASRGKRKQQCEPHIHTFRAEGSKHPLIPSSKLNAAEIAPFRITLTLLDWEADELGPRKLQELWTSKLRAFRNIIVFSPPRPPLEAILAAVSNSRA